MEKILDGKKLADQLLQSLKVPSPAPGIAFVRVGEDPASISYVQRKQKIAENLGIRSQLFALDYNVAQAKLNSLVEELNADPKINGILIQAPLPKHLNFEEACNKVDWRKDVDGFNAQNFGKLIQGCEQGFLPCTPYGIVELLKNYKINLRGKRVVIINRSMIVGKPLALKLMAKTSELNPVGDATVTVCHSRTENLARITREADVLITAVGKPEFLDKNYVKKGAVVIDVGIHRQTDASSKRGYRIVGDVKFDEVYPIVSKITPVPGGVGPMTVAMLMYNTVKAYKLQNNQT